MNLSELYRLNFSKSISTFLNKKSHIIISASTGMGKSILGNILQLQACTMPVKAGKIIGSAQVPTQLFEIDLKKESSYRLGQMMPKNLISSRCAGDKESAVKVIESFVSQMKQREDYLLEKPYGSTFADYKMSLYMLCIDEAAVTTEVFNRATTKEEKVLKMRYLSAIDQIILMGRALGFEIMLITQQKSAQNSGLKTLWTDNILNNIFLGNPSDEQFRQTFGNSYEKPILTRPLGVGEGLIWISGNNFVEPFAAPKVDLTKLGAALSNWILKTQSDDFLLKENL